MDDLLLGHSTAVGSAEGTDALLRHLEDCGYKVSKKKAQICRQQVRYLGFTIPKGECSLGSKRKQVIWSLPEPKTRRQVREFLGAVGFCRIWIPNFAVLAKPLYGVTKGGDQEPFEWRPVQQQAFRKLKEKLMSAPALGLPDLTKPFTLYVSEREKMAIRVLTQTVEPRPRPVAYLSKQLDGVSKGWPPCLRAWAATALLAQEADKLTLGQNPNIKARHAVVTLMNQRTPLANKC
nr:uncharacterized protein LOC112423611 [Macaca nemestrina]